MKEIKSKTINFKILLFALSFLFFFISTNDLNSLNLYVLSIIISLIGLAFYQITLDKQGIVKKNLLFPFLKTTKTWEQIKYYVPVKEFNIDYYSSYRFDIYSLFERLIYNRLIKREVIKSSNGELQVISNCIWFVDRNDKVCLRLNLDYISNSKEVLRSIDLNEKMYGDKFEVYNPSFPFFGKKNFDSTYFPRNDEEIMNLENKLTDSEKIKLNNLRNRKTKGDKVYQISRDLNLNMFFRKTE
jgi:hypothetical protein